MKPPHRLRILVPLLVLSLPLSVSAGDADLQSIFPPDGEQLDTVGHRERVQQVEARLSALPGLFLTGNLYRGVALNDCTQNAVQVADAVTGYLAPPA